MKNFYLILAIVICATALFACSSENTTPDTADYDFSDYFSDTEESSENGTVAEGKGDSEQEQEEVPEATSSTQAPSSTTAPATTTTAPPTTTTKSSGLSLDFKAAMDSYESFMNEYVEFMNEKQVYNENGDGFEKDMLIIVSDTNNFFILKHFRLLR